MGRILVKVTFLAIIVTLGLTTTSSVMAESEQQPADDVTEENSPTYYYGDDSYEYLDVIANWDRQPQGLVDGEQIRAKRLALKAKSGLKIKLPSWGGSSRPIKGYSTSITNPFSSSRWDQFYSHITLLNRLWEDVHLQCGTDKYDSSNKEHIIKPSETTDYIFKPGSTYSTNTLWCTAQAGNRLMAFAAYGSGAPKTKRIAFEFRDYGLWLNGKLVVLWV